MTAALKLANADYARLRQLHQVEWQIDILKAVRWLCNCDNKPRTSAQLDIHILEEVREARGPVKSK